MAEHWKSTPRYWCKHCSAYVRDTKLERQNHEATAKHQGAVKRSLRELHRGKENEERDKERARREIERLNGVVSSSSAGGGGGGASSRLPRAGGASAAGGGGRGGAPSESERKRQAEQLASLGVSIPEQFRGDMAMAGEWTVTATTVVEERPKEEDLDPEARARGVHKRERTEEEKEEDDAVKGLFKKPRRWGRDSKIAGGGASEDLDALLSGGLVVKTKEEGGDDAGANVVKAEVGAEPSAETQTQGEDIKHERDEELPAIKKEPSHEDDPIAADVPEGPDGNKSDVPLIKNEDDQGASASAGAPVVAFKKRKPKNIRQK